MVEARDKVEETISSFIKEEIVSSTLSRASIDAKSCPPFETLWNLAF